MMNESYAVLPAVPSAVLRFERHSAHLRALLAFCAACNGLATAGLTFSAIAVPESWSTAAAANTTIATDFLMTLLSWPHSLANKKIAA